MVTWSTLDPASGRLDLVECYPDLESALRDMAGQPAPRRPGLDFVTGVDTGEVLAAGVWSPESEYYACCSDGRRLTFGGGSP